MTRIPEVEEGSECPEETGEDSGPAVGLTDRRDFLELRPNGSRDLPGEEEAGAFTWTGSPRPRRTLNQTLGEGSVAEDSEDITQTLTAVEEGLTEAVGDEEEAGTITGGPGATRGDGVGQTGNEEE